MKTLVLYSRYLGTKKASYYDDWLDAFSKDVDFDVTARNISPPYVKVPSTVRFTPPITDPSLRWKVSLYKWSYQMYTRVYQCAVPPFYRRGRIVDLTDVDQFDLIVLLHSTNANSVTSLTHILPYLQSRKGKLVCFVGNEYCLMPEKIGFIKSVAADLIATQLPIEAAQWLYGDCLMSRVVPIPHALNADNYASLTPRVQRPVEIGFIGDRYSLAIGDNERSAFIEAVQSLCQMELIPYDIRLGSKLRIPRKAYTSFLNRVKTVIGAESGTYYLEKTDALFKKVDAYLSFRPRARFGEVHDRFFKNYHQPVSGKAISSRHFEPIGTQTAQMLLRGHYNGILRPDEHYIPVRRDLSDMEEAFAKLADKDTVDQMVERTHQYVMDCHTYDHRIGTLKTYL